MKIICDPPHAERLVLQRATAHKPAARQVGDTRALPSAMVDNAASQTKEESLRDNQVWRANAPAAKRDSSASPKWEKADNCPTERTG